MNGSTLQNHPLVLILASCCRMTETLDIMKLLLSLDDVQSGRLDGDNVRAITNRLMSPPYILCKTRETGGGSPKRKLVVLHPHNRFLTTKIIVRLMPHTHAPHTNPFRLCPYIDMVSSSSSRVFSSSRSFYNNTTTQQHPSGLLVVNSALTFIISKRKFRGRAPEFFIFFFISAFFFPPPSINFQQHTHTKKKILIVEIKTKRKKKPDAIIQVTAFFLSQPIRSLWETGASWHNFYTPRYSHITDFFISKAGVSLFD